MKKSYNIILITIMAFVLIFPYTVSAKSIEENENERFLVAQTKKYFKTVTTYDNSIYNIESKSVLNSIYNAKSVTTEITEEEYNNANVKETYEVNDTTSVETTYKLMITSIYKEGSSFTYENIVNWKNFPKVRDYDVIGIGFLGCVTPNTITFELRKCSKSKGCTSSSTNTSQVFSNGSSATFSLPTWDDLTSLKATYTINVKKVTSSSTVTLQAVYGDYAHATKTTGLTKAKKHKVLQGAGIVFDSGIEDNFDTIDEADVFWEGTW